MLTYVWSDVFDLHLGPPATRASTTSSFSADTRGWTLHGPLPRGRGLRAYFAVNGDSRERPVLQRLIRTGAIPYGREEQLRDPAFGIAGLP